MPARIIHIGTGTRGRHWIEFVNNHPETESAACVDARAGAFDEIKGRLGEDRCGFFTDLDEALQKTDADAAIIASPSVLHAEHALKALDAGLAVMTEKPFAADLEQARAVLRKAGETGKPVLVAENYRFWPAERTVRKLVAEGLPGDIASVTLTDRRNQPSHTEGPWMAELEHPQLQEIAIHHFDSLRGFFDRNPVTIFARTWNPPSSDYRAGACTEALIEMEGGLHVQYYGTLTSNNWSYSLWIEGEKGVLWTNRKFVFWRERGKRFFKPVRLVKVPKGDGAKYPRGGTTALLNSLVNAVRDGKPAETSGQDNIWTLATVEAGKISDRERRTVSVAEMVGDAGSAGKEAGEYGGAVQAGLEVRPSQDGRPSGQVRSGSSRVLMIGMDIADADLIDRWCNEGHLPTLQSLRKQGVWGRLGTSAEVMHVSSWPTIHTGTHPDKHGIYHAYQINAGEQNIHRSQAKECAQPPFWKFLDDAGRKCVVMDAFFNAPLAGFQGTQILEYGTWTWFADPMARPKRVWKEIIREFGPYPSPEHTKVLTVPEPREFRDGLAAAAATKSKIVRWLAKKEPWDMLYVTFAETHPAGHYLWHLSDPSHPAHPEGGIEGLENALRDVYAAVDRAIGEILAELDDSVTVVVTSGDGIGPNYAGCHMIPEVLNRLGLYYGANVGKPEAAESGESDSAKQTKKGITSVLRELIPLSARQAVTSRLPRSIHYKMSMKWVNTGHDWTRSKAFTIPNANEGYVRINLKGREPQGIVEEGAAYRELIAEIQDALKELVNPVNGKPAVSRIYCIDDVYPGDRRPNLPDLAITWDPDARVLEELGSDRCGRVKKPAGYQIAPYYTGNHRPSAFVIARGPGLAEGSLLQEGHIVDIAPTIMTMIGVDPPGHMDGRVWSEFAPAS